MILVSLIRVFFFLFFVILVSLIIRDTNITKNRKKNTRKVMYYNTVQSQFNATYKISLVNNECRVHNIKYHGAEAEKVLTG